MHPIKLAALLLMLLPLAACSTLDRLSGVGEAPKLSAISNPTAQPGYRKVNLPMPAPVVASYQPNSLFSNEARGFFKDQRAHRIGDILTVNVAIADTAQISNQTARNRKSSNTAGMGGLLNTVVGTAVPGVDLSSAVDITSGAGDTGTGSVNRKETIDTAVAAVVVQVLPNGNLVIEGRQEVRVNFEVRDLIVAGIVRPEDIHSDNTIPSSKIAEARISYGGRGQITDVQQPRYGQQVLDAILPF